MKRPRFTIGGLMFVVLLVAANFAAIRFANDDSDDSDWNTSEFLAVVLPMANIVTVAIAKIWRPHSRRESASAFLIGFTSAGFLVCSVVAISMLSTSGYNGIGHYFRWTLGWTIPSIQSMMHSQIPAQVNKGIILYYGLAALDSTLSQLAIAVVAGWLFRKSAITIPRPTKRENSKTPALHESIP